MIVVPIKLDVFSQLKLLKYLPVFYDFSASDQFPTSECPKVHFVGLGFIYSSRHGSPPAYDNIRTQLAQTFVYSIILSTFKCRLYIIYKIVFTI